MAMIPLRRLNGLREGAGGPLSMFTSTLFNQVLTREGEAPAEPMRRQLGRSLALPLLFARVNNPQPHANSTLLSVMLSTSAQVIERNEPLAAWR